MLNKKASSEQILRTYFKVLNRFFNSCGGFAQAKGTLKNLLHFSFSEMHIPTREEISVLRSMQKSFTALMEETFQVNDTGIFNALPPSEEVFTPFGHPRSESYNDPTADAGLTPWEFYPHFLSKEEFINPYGFFEKFFGYRELSGWKVVLEEIFHASLLHQSIIDFSDNIDNALLLQEFFISVFRGIPSYQGSSNGPLNQ